MRRKWISLIRGAAICCVLITSRVSGADKGLNEVRSGQADIDQALHDVFGEGTLRRNVLAVRSTAAGLPLRARYEYLVGEVLPHAARRSFRLSIAFAPTDPAEPIRQWAATSAADDTAGGLINKADGLIDAGTQQTGGQLLSPVLDLMETAARLDVLPELYDQVASVEVTDVQSVRERATVLALIQMQRGETESAMSHVIQLLNTADEAADDRAVIGGVDRTQVAEMLVFHQAAKSPAVARAIVGDATELAMLQKEEGRWDPLSRHLTAVAERLRERVSLGQTGPEGQADSKVQPPLRGNGIAIDGAVGGQSAANTSGNPQSAGLQWHAVSRWTAQTRGTGLPPSRWLIRDERADNTVSHDHDFLYFASPLRGDFEVECEVTAFNRAGSELMFDCRRVSPSWRRVSGTFGDLRDQDRVFDLPAKMTGAAAWMRYRLVVSGDTVKTYFNGQHVHTRPLSADHDPWLAVRNDRNVEGSVRNLRISGAAVIPESIRLDRGSQLDGWLSYFEGAAGAAEFPWRVLPDELNGGGMLGQRTEALAGTNHEQAVHYHRPMLEDGEIEYEFYYRPNSMHVHPAMDRLCFMLTASGVKFHWLTDGAYDRSELEAGNLDDLSGEQALSPGQGHPAALPLFADAWNRVRLSLTGDVVQLTLNDRPICERRLEPANQRHFGLFHFADQTEARVRNVLWRGDWPRELPEPGDQQLADRKVVMLETSFDRLAESFEHDFRDGLPVRLFTVHGNGWQDHVVSQADGVHVRRPGIDAYCDYTITPKCQLQGDFDVIAGFDSLETVSVPDGLGLVQLRIGIDDARSTESSLFRQTRLDEQNELEHTLHVMSSERREGEERTYYIPYRQAGEATSGRLRIARRGDRMYYLISEGDSPVFHLLAEEPTAPDATRPFGIRLMTQTKLRGEASVVWKDISIRAEQIVQPDRSVREFSVAELDADRERYTTLLDRDFRSPSALDAPLVRHGRMDLSTRNPEGLQIVSPGASNWTSTGFFNRLPVTGDCDIQLDFEVLKMDSAAEYQESTVYISAEFDGPGRPEVHSKYSNNSEGLRVAECQIRTTRSDGSFQYNEPYSVNADAVTGLRIARRGKVAYMLYRRKGSEAFELLGIIDVGSGNIQPNGNSMQIHTGGADRETRVLLKRYSIRVAGN